MTTRIPLALMAVAVALLPVQGSAFAGQHEELPRNGYLGVRLALLSDDVRTREQLGRGSGVLIEAVIPDTTAADDGIKPADVLLAVDGRMVSGVADVMTAIAHAPGRHPVLFLIQGLGPATVDQPLSGPEPYSRILSEFAGGNYVTVRVEKPGIGDSEGGPFADLDFQTELDAYRQAMTEVRKYAFVDVDKIFIFGHSMGGVFGPIIASEIPVRGIAVYGTVSKTLMEYLLENWRRQAILGGNDPAQIDSAVRDLTVALHYLLMEQKRPEEILRARPDLRPILAKLAPASGINGRSLRFWSQLATRNLPAYWAKGNADVLAMWGKNDFIATEADHPFIAEIVNKARPGKGTYLALESSDHGFRKTTSIEDSFKRWSSPAGEFNPLTITTLKEWMEKVRIVQ